jgi:hypothetical protein
MQSRVIFQNQHYTACALRDGSWTVESNRKCGYPRGKRLTGADAATWIDAISAAIDAIEAHDLCRAILAE